MDAYLAHTLILLWAAIGASRRLVIAITDRIIAAMILAWANLVVTGLLLSAVGRLGDPTWFFVISSVLAIAVWVWAGRLPPETLALLPTAVSSGHRAVGVFLLLMLPYAAAIATIAWTYAPNSHDAQVWQIPRTLYYLGQQSLAAFPAADLRQTLQPFGTCLLYAFSLTYGAPLACLNLIPFAAWVACGLGIYRLCRLSNLGVFASLVASWLALINPPMVGAVLSLTDSVPAAAGLTGAFIFAQRWLQTRQARHATLTLVAVSLAASTSLFTLMGCLLIALPCGLFLLRQLPGKPATRHNRSAMVLIGLVLTATYAVVNLQGSLPGLLRYVGFITALPSLPSPLLPSNREHMGLGLASVILLAGALWSMRFTRIQTLLAGMGILGVAVWFLAALGSAAWLGIRAVDMVPILVLLAPGFATALTALSTQPGTRRYFALAGAFLACGLAAWSSSIHLLRNNHRPLLPRFEAAFQPTAPPVLPLLINHHLSRATRINIDSDGVNEAILPFMTLGRHQHFTAHLGIVPDSFTLLSRANASRNAAWHTSPPLTAYSLIPIPAKRTAGVEFLATVGEGPDARDYFGVVPNAGHTLPINSNRNILVSLHRESSVPDRARLIVAGLNPKDQAYLAVNLEQHDGHVVSLAGFNQDGETTVKIESPFRQLAFRVHERESGAEIGATALPHLPVATEITPADPLRPTGVDSIFVTDLVISHDITPLSVETLLPVEGPFPQWDLPLIRWARQPSVRITIPPHEQFNRLQMSYSVRVHVREKAALDVFFNNRLVQSHRIENNSLWIDQTLDLKPQPGVNVLEFRDAPINDGPDWLHYLESHPDVLEHVSANRLSPEQGARDHYETHGLHEGRTIQIIAKPEPAPDGYYFMFRSIRLEGFSSP